MTFFYTKEVIEDESKIFVSCSLIHIPDLENRKGKIVY